MGQDVEELYRKVKGVELNPSIKLPVGLLFASKGMFLGPVPVLEELTSDGSTFCVSEAVDLLLPDKLTWVGLFLSSTAKSNNVFSIIPAKGTNTRNHAKYRIVLINPKVMKGSST